MRRYLFITLAMLLSMMASAQKTASKKTAKREVTETGEQKLVKPEKSDKKVDTAGVHTPNQTGSGMTTAGDNPPDKLDRTNQGEIPQLPSSGASR